MIQVLVDADNVSPARQQALLRALPLGEADVTVAGSASALAAVRWPPRVAVHEVVGWQQADLLLVAAYRIDAEPLVLASGDGDFAMLARKHSGPVLIVSDRPAARLRAAGTVVDPVTDGGLDALRRWFEAVLDPQPD